MYIYKTKLSSIITEIICVSLEVKVNKEWITIIFYDSSHQGRLHRHTKIFINNDLDVVDYQGVKQKGNQKALLTWAINDLKNNYLFYKKKFIKRNKDLLKNINIEKY